MLSLTLFNPIDGTSHPGLKTVTGIHRSPQQTSLALLCFTQFDLGYSHPGLKSIAGFHFLYADRTCPSMLRPLGLPADTVQVVELPHEYSSTKSVS